VDDPAEDHPCAEPCISPTTAHGQQRATLARQRGSTRRSIENMSTDHAAVWAAPPDHLRDKLGTDASLTAEDGATFRQLGIELVRESQRAYPRTYDKLPVEFAEYAADQLDAMADAIQAPGVNAAKIPLDDAAHKEVPMVSDAEVTEYDQLRARARRLRGA
jgi:hypothetical protein